MVGKKVAVFDIDGCLVTTNDIYHRGYIPDRDFWKSRWSATGEEAPDPNPQIVDLAQALLDSGWGIVYLTARPESFRGDTLNWLNRHDLLDGSYTLVMLPDREGIISGGEWKANKVRGMIDRGWDVRFAVEDYPDNAYEIRRHVPVLLYEMQKPLTNST